MTYSKDGRLSPFHKDEGDLLLCVFKVRRMQDGCLNLTETEVSPNIRTAFGQLVAFKRVVNGLKNAVQDKPLGLS